MRLRLSVISYRAMPPEQQISCLFEWRGGTLGREAANDLVLADPEEYVSRTHARVDFRDGAYFLADTSTNGTFVNESPNRLAHGEQHCLEEGDRIVIGDYILIANLEPDPAELAPGPAGAEQTDQGSGDSFAAPPEFGVDFQGLPGDREWDDNVKRPEWFPTEAGSGEASRCSREPSLSERPVSVLRQHMAPPRAAPDQAAAQPRSGDQEVPAQEESQRSGPPTGYVPFAEVLGLGTAPAPSRADDGAGPAEEAPADAGSAEEALDEGSGEPASAAAEPHAQENGPSAPAAPAQPPTTPLADEALQAFLEGLGATSLEIPPDRAAQIMGLMGEVLREALLGAIELLRLRAGFKREFYIPGTSIAPVENNPLKYAADLDDALMRLFGRKTSAYLPPVQATRQAFEDVAAHQVAMVAGLEAAVASLLERFEPERLEERLGGKSMLDGLVPLNRKAKFWDLFTREYRQIAQDARDDFNRAFGQSFARAYLRQIAGLGKAGFGEGKPSQ